MDNIKRALDYIIPLLESHRVTYHITGGFAVYLYGGTRAVNDIDIDLPNSGLQAILPAVSPFIESGPERYKDSTWDIDLVTLNYHGQLIDLSVAEDAYIVNHRVGAREPLPIDFRSARKIVAFGHTLFVQDPTDLIEYKSKIVFEESKHSGDVEVVRLFLNRPS